jgi:DNA polymerase-3 subunit gamma/tau
MSYLVLARKWRPQSFEEVSSQSMIIRTLQNAVMSDRISHAYLFSGPRGVGKTTTARILAKCLNCQSTDKPTPSPCNHCVSCIEIAESRSPDVREIDGASNRSVEDIQPLREHVQYAPQGRFKIVIIDEVHMLTNHAFNAILKTLEEPPEYVVFIFATTEPEKIPATIISRCQRHDFRRIPDENIMDRLMELAKNEGVDLERSAAAIIAKKADGAMRDALSLFDQIIAYSPNGVINSDTASCVLGLLPSESFLKLATFAIIQDTKELLLFLDNIRSMGISPMNIAESLIEGYRTLMVKKLSGNALEEAESVIVNHYEISDFVRIMRVVSETIQKKRYSRNLNFH